MKLCFGSNRIDRICNDPTAARRKLPTQKHVDKLYQRLQELASFQRLSDIPSAPPLRRHKLKGKRKEMWAIDILNKTDGWRICFTPVDFDQAQDGSITIESVVSICIVDIGDYHNG